MYVMYGIIRYVSCMMYIMYYNPRKTSAERIICPLCALPKFGGLIFLRRHRRTPDTFPLTSSLPPLPNRHAPHVPVAQTLVKPEPGHVPADPLQQSLLVAPARERVVHSEHQVDAV